MNSFLLFVRVEITAVVSLLLAASVLALLAAAPFGNPGTAFLDSKDAAAFFFTSTLFLGAIPVIVLGGPIYFFMLKQREPLWLHVILLGVTPGLALLVFDYLLGTLAVACGIFVASLTHLGCRRFGPGQSSRPTPSARNGIGDAS